MLVYLGRYDEARERLTQAATLRMPSHAHTASAEAHASLGKIHTCQGQYDEALAEFKLALAADPNNEAACADFAELLLALGEQAKATGMIERAIELEPFNARNWELKGRILRAAGDESGADAAEAHGQAMLAEQRAALAAWEREHPEWAALFGE
jgi:tetratricopeptide (TPR) repeat protein